MYQPLLLGGYFVLEVLEFPGDGPPALLGVHVVVVGLARLALVLLPGALGQQQLKERKIDVFFFKRDLISVLSNY